MKRKIATLAVAAVAAMGVAAPSAFATSRWQAAMAATTNSCLRYTGCSQISFNQYQYRPATCSNGIQYHYNFHTTYYGWLQGWTSIYCSPPYTL